MYIYMYVHVADLLLYVTACYCTFRRHWISKNFIVGLLFHWQVPTLALVHLVRDLALSLWTTSTAMDQRTVSWTAVTLVTAMAAPIVMMSVFAVSQVYTYADFPANEIPQMYMYLFLRSTLSCCTASSSQFKIHKKPYDLRSSYGCIIVDLCQCMYLICDWVFLLSLLFSYV